MYESRWPNQRVKNQELETQRGLMSSSAPSLHDAFQTAYQNASAIPTQASAAQTMGGYMQSASTTPMTYSAPQSSGLMSGVPQAVPVAPPRTRRPETFRGYAERRPGMPMPIRARMTQAR